MRNIICVVLVCIAVVLLQVAPAAALDFSGYEGPVTGMSMSNPSNTGLNVQSSSGGVYFNSPSSSSPSSSPSSSTPGSSPSSSSQGPGFYSTNPNTGVRSFYPVSGTPTSAPAAAPTPASPASSSTTMPGTSFSLGNISSTLPGFTAGTAGSFTGIQTAPNTFSVPSAPSTSGTMSAPTTISMPVSPVMGGNNLPTGTQFSFSYNGAGDVTGFTAVSPTTGSTLATAVTTPTGQVSATVNMNFQGNGVGSYGDVTAMVPGIGEAMSQSGNSLGIKAGDAISVNFTDGQLSGVTVNGAALGQNDLSGIGISMPSASSESASPVVGGLTEYAPVDPGGAIDPATVTQAEVPVQGVQQSAEVPVSADAVPPAASEAPAQQMSNAVTGNYIDTKGIGLLTLQTNGPQTLGAYFVDNKGNVTQVTDVDGNPVQVQTDENGSGMAMLDTFGLGVGNIYLVDGANTVVGIAAQSTQPTDGATPYTHLDTSIDRALALGTLGNALDPSNQYSFGGAQYANTYSDQLEKIQCTFAGNVFGGSASPIQGTLDWIRATHNLSVDQTNKYWDVVSVCPIGLHAFSTTDPSTGQTYVGGGNAVFPYLFHTGGISKVIDNTVELPNSTEPLPWVIGPDGQPLSGSEIFPQWVNVPFAEVMAAQQGGVE